jgi:ATP-dependent DNA helicase RecG
VSTLKGDLLRKELDIARFGDLLQHFPIRHVDKTKIEQIGSLTHHNEYAQVAGIVRSMEIIGEKRGRRLVVTLRDKTGEIELVWFQGISWMQKALQVGKAFLVFGRLGFFMGKPQIAHPEMVYGTKARGQKLSGAGLSYHRKIKSERDQRQGIQQIHLCFIAVAE